MKRWVWLLLVPLLLIGGVTKKRGPGSRETAGGSEAMFEFCKKGGKGVGFINDTYGGTYSATCGNYAWSAESGGMSGGFASTTSYKTPTTAGGNRIKLTCTARGIGTGDDGVTYNTATPTEIQPGAPTDLTAGAGSGASTWVDGTGGFTTNAFRGQILWITTAGGGPTLGTRRLIVSNTATTLTVDGTWPTANPVNGATRAAIYDPIGSLCHFAGEVVLVNAMADIMLAQDHTRLGGTVYFPNVTAANNTATIYADRGCGRKRNAAASGGTVFNTCPVLRAPLDEHLQRQVQRVGARNWHWEGLDPSGEETGRTGAYLVADRGSWNNAGDAFSGIDDADGVATSQWMGANGTRGNGNPRHCDMTAGLCAPATGSQTTDTIFPGSITSSAWGRSFTLAHTADETDNDFCFNNVVGTSGTCRDDRRVRCTAGANCTTAGLANATCDSAIDAIEYEVVTLRRTPMMMFANASEAFPETGTNSATEAGYASITAVPKATGTCTNGATATASVWPLLAGRIRPGSGSASIFDQETYNMSGSAWEGGTMEPNNFYGFDIDQDGVSDPGDCLSAADTDETDDEPECDTQNMSPLLGGLHPAYKNLNMNNCSTENNSCFDGSTESLRPYADTLTLSRIRRGPGCDISDVQMTNFMIRDSNMTDACNIQFHGDARFDGGEFINVSSTQGSVLNITNGMNGVIKNVRFVGVNSAGFAIVTVHGVSAGTLFDDIEFIGTNKPGFYVSGFAGTMGQTFFNNIRATGNLQMYTGVGGGQGLFLIGRVQGHTDLPIMGVTISNAYLASRLNDQCLVVFDDDVAGTGTVTDANRSRVSIRDSAIQNLGTSTGDIPLCVADMDAVNGNAATDTGVFNQRHVPVWTNLSANGVGIPDQPHRQTVAAQCGDCDDPDLWGRVCFISDDITGAGTCGDAGADGILDGASTFKSLCQCDTDTVWKPVGTL